MALPFEKDAYGNKTFVQQRGGLSNREASPGCGNQGKGVNNHAGNQKTGQTD